MQSKMATSLVEIVMFIHVASCNKVQEGNWKSYPSIKDLQHPQLLSPHRVIWNQKSLTGGLYPLFPSRNCVKKSMNL